MRPVGHLRALCGRLQWRRGLRAALAVAAALLFCRAFGQPSGWAALGGFEAILVDNGGSYRSRLDTILTVLAGGSASCPVGGVRRPAGRAAPGITPVRARTPAGRRSPGTAPGGGGGRGRVADAAH